MNEGNGDNYKAIFSRNKKSPVLLRIAEEEISLSNFGKAIDILESALADNPGNAAAYFLLGKAYTGAGNYRTALQNFKKGSDLIRSEKTYRYYLKEIEFCKRQQEQKETSSGSGELADYSRLISASDEPQAAYAEPSEHDENIISETLAKIYLSQGQSGEAVKVYQKLIRKYPLKKLFFEAKIREITSGAE